MPIVSWMKDVPTSGHEPAATARVGPADGAGGLEGLTVTVELIVVAGAAGVPLDVQPASAPDASTSTRKRHTATILTSRAAGGGRMPA
jgi:hypothetical protein